MKKVMKLLNRLAAMIGIALLFSSCYTADAALPRSIVTTTIIILSVV